MEINRSLKTYSSVIARRFAAKVSAQVQETFVVIEKNVKISPSEARGLIQSCFADLTEELEQYLPYVPASRYPDLELLEQEILAQEKINQLQRRIIAWNFGPDISRKASSYLQKQGISFEIQGDQDQLKLMHGFTQALIEEQRYFQHRLRSPLAAYHAQNSIFQIPEPQNFSVNQPSGPTPGFEGVTVRQAVADYLKAKEKSWIAKTHNARVWQLGYLVEFLGEGKRLSDVMPADILEYRKKLIALRAKHGQGKSLGFFEKLTDNDSARIKNKTARLIYEPTQAFFRWAKSEEGLIAINPAADVKWIAQKITKGVFSRRPYTEAELSILFGSPLFTGCKSKHRRFVHGEHVFKDAKYWIPILGYYTGARLGELVQLHLTDVKLDGDTPYLDLNEKQGLGDKKHIKSSAGVRQIPLHPDVLQLGFGDFVAQRRKWKHPSKRLFSEMKFGTDGQASTEFSKIFARFLDKVGLNEPALTFHSFRHGMADILRDAEIPLYEIDRILGHDSGTMNAQYGNGSSIEVLYASLQKAKFIPSLTDVVGI